jgi:hypothetical protein
MDFRFSERRARRTTIGQFLDLWERWVDEQDRLNYRAAVVAACVVNASPKGRRKAAQPRDIIPALRERVKEQHFNSMEDQVAALKFLYGDAVTVDVIPPDDEAQTEEESE